MKQILIWALVVIGLGVIVGGAFFIHPGLSAIATGLLMLQAARMVVANELP